VPEFLTRIPTTENLAIAIWQRLAPKLNAAQLAPRARLRKRPICSSIFTGGRMRLKHESPPHPPLHVFRFAPLA